MSRQVARGDEAGRHQAPSAGPQGGVTAMTWHPASSLLQAPDNGVGPARAPGSDAGIDAVTLAVTLGMECKLGAKPVS